MKLRRGTLLSFALFALVFFSLSLPSHASSGKTRIHFLTLNDESDAILLESNGHFGMVDSGEDSDYPDGTDSKYPLREGITTTKGFEDQVIRYMKNLGVKKLDFYIGTHAHSDHIGSGDEILKAFKTDKLYLRKYSDKNISKESHLWDNRYCYDTLMNTARRRGTEIIQNFDNPENRTITLGDMTIELMNWEIRTKRGRIVKQEDDNNNALGVKITAFDQTAFLASDINNNGPERDETALAKELGHVNLLKLGHHGYSGSNSPGYLKKLSPDYAVLTGPPSNLTNAQMNALESSGTRIYTTSNQPKHSAVIAEFSDEEGLTLIHPKSLTLKGTKKQAFYTPSNRRYTELKGWYYYNQNYYYLDKRSYIKKNSWIYSGENWYYFDCNGVMVTDALRTTDGVYGFYANGRLAHGGWVRGRNYYSYTKPNGKAVTGWQNINRKTYYFDRNGRMVTGLREIRGHHYYFLDSGAMKRGGKVILDDAIYYIAKSGICYRRVPIIQPTE